MSAIESLKHRAVSFAGDNAKLKKATEAVFNELVKTNKNNIEALLPIQDVPFNKRELRWSELNWEDIEVAYTYQIDDPITGETGVELTPEERDEALEKAREMRDHQRGPALVKAYQELVDVLEDAEEKYTELVWNFSWQPYGDQANIELANQIPQLMGVTYKDDKYITLSSCGQDNGPAIMAYIAIEHEVIDREHASYLTTDHGLDWTLHVIGRTWLMKVAKALGVTKQIKSRLASMAAKRAAQAKAAEARRLLREAVRLTPLSAVLREMLVSAYMLNPYARWDDTPSLYESEDVLREVTEKADAWNDQSRYIYLALGLTDDDAAARSDQLEAAKKANANPAGYMVHTHVGGTLPADNLLVCRTCGHFVGTTIKAVGTTMFRVCETCGETYAVTKADHG